MSDDPPKVSSVGGRWVLFGGNGFIGRHLVERIRLVYPEVELDICGRDEMPSVPLGRCKFIFLMQRGGSPSGYSEDMALTRKVLQSIKYSPRAKVIFFSSTAVYGSTDQKYEFAYLQPHSQYGNMKLAQEKVVQQWCHYGNYLILRIADVYGELRPNANVLDKWLEARMMGNPIQVFERDCELDLIHVDDVAAIVLQLALQEESGIINVGTGRGTKVNELADYFVAKHGADRIDESKYDDRAGIVPDVTKLAQMGIADFQKWEDYIDREIENRRKSRP